MAILMNQTKNIQLISHLENATSFFARAKGLLGKKSIDANYALHIHKCNSIHTFFMNFPIDAVFLDKKLIVKAIIKNLKPQRLTLPNFTYHSVIEFKGGVIHPLNLEVGDQLYVGN